MLSQSEIIEELLDRDKIKPNRSIEIISIINPEKHQYDYNVHCDYNSKVKYLVIFFSAMSEKLLDDLLVQFDMTHIIIIVCHQRYYYFWGKSTLMDELYKMLRERYIRVLDVDRLYSRENWFSTDELFSVILITK
jgi:hypothetical protein